MVPPLLMKVALPALALSPIADAPPSLVITTFSPAEAVPSK
jgi:hypothetical protein